MGGRRSGSVAAVTSLGAGGTRLLQRSPREISGPKGAAFHSEGILGSAGSQAEAKLVHSLLQCR